jgi:uncharacterized caspase-like protein
MMGQKMEIWRGVVLVVVVIALGQVPFFHKELPVCQAEPVLEFEFTDDEKPVSSPAALFDVSVPSSVAKKVALVIGNSSYDTAPLKNPVNDAMDMAALLKNAGFEVILRKDADKLSMLESIEDFGKKMLRAEIAMFFYAGHGVQALKRNYLVPVKAQIASETDVELESVGVNEILDRMEAAAIPLNIFILDASLNNPFEPFSRPAKKGLAIIDAPPRSIIFLATVPGGIAEDGQGRNGIFTEHLLKNFQTPGLEVYEVFIQTGKDVIEKTGGRQMPWISTSLLRHDFYMAGGAP